MTQVDFYSGVEDKLRTACTLTHKAMQNSVRVLLHVPEETTATALDQLLWEYPALAFMPHCRSTEPSARTMPVVIDHLGESFPHNELLISLHTACLPFFSRFERLIEIVSRDETDARLGRERFSFYRDHGYQIRHFNLSNQPSR